MHGKDQSWRRERSFVFIGMRDKRKWLIVKDLTNTAKILFPPNSPA